MIHTEMRDIRHDAIMIGCLTNLNDELMMRIFSKDNGMLYCCSGAQVAL